MEFDSRLTFETFVVGPANRLAYAAARRAAESPGTSYNPLFLYAGSGLGKTHILSAMAQYILKNHPERKVEYLPLENYLDELTKALERGEQDEMKERFSGLDTLLMDDVQFLTGQSQAQEMFLRALDHLTSRSAQVVLASDRPPSEIDDLDARLLSRFSGGLIVDIGSPDYETRVAIMRRKADERGTTLGPGVAEAMARFKFSNVRELQGALNRLLAIQELEGRPVSVDDLPVLMGERAEGTADEPEEEEFTEFLEQLGEGSAAAGAADPLAPEAEPEQPEEPAWLTQLRDELEAATQEGFRSGQMSRLMEAVKEGADAEGLEEAAESFQKALARAREIEDELERLGNPWPEATATLVKDLDRQEEAENLLASARERARPFPDLPDGPKLEELKGKFPPLAVRAAERLITADRPDYNPLYLHSDKPELCRSLLEAAGRSYLARNPEGRVGLASLSEFSEEFIAAISEGVAGAWRERWWTADVLLLHGLEELTNTERAQDELFHLFEALKRRESRMLLASDRSPSGIEGIDERLSSRFEGGLVVELGEETAQIGRGGGPQPEAAPAAAPEPAEPASEPAEPTSEPAEPEPEPAEPAPEPAAAAPEPEESTPEPREPAASPAAAAAAEAVDDKDARPEMAGIGRGKRSAEAEDQAEDLIVAVPEATEEEEEPDEEAWFPSRERVVWDWPRLQDCVVEENA